MNVRQRAALHSALGDETRLGIIDELFLDDRTPVELARKAGISSNLLAHHLGVLEQCGLVDGHRSEGDQRRRYLTLRRESLPGLALGGSVSARSILFVCTHNSARSQFAEAALRNRIDVVVQSAGTNPADRLHPKAIAAAAELGVDLGQGHPKGYDEIQDAPDLLISVCDRAREAPAPFESPRVHWSVPDPVAVNRMDAFRAVFAEIHDRVDQLAEAIQGGKSL